MDLDDKKPFSKAMASMFSVYVMTVTEDMLTAWWRALSKYELREITAAFTAHLTDPAYGFRQPTPADIVKHLEITIPARLRAHYSTIVHSARTQAAEFREQLRMLETERLLGLQPDEEKFAEQVRELQHAISSIMNSPDVCAARRALEPPPVVKPKRIGMAPAKTIVNSIKGMLHGQRD